MVKHFLMQNTIHILMVTIIMVLVFDTKVFAEEWEHVPTIEKDVAVNSIEIAPFGILLGEYGHPGDYSGMHLSRDNGETWEKIGLEYRKVEDIAYDNGVIYVATHDVVNNQNGLFISRDAGQTWEHPSGIGFTTLAVAADGENVGIGTGSHGLWMSFDGGVTWEQKIGSGIYGPDVYELTFTDGVYLASVQGLVYVSHDKGHTWTSNHYPDLNVWYLDAQENVAIARPFGNGELFRSVNYGNTWSIVPGWNKSLGSAITVCDNVFFTGFNRDNQMTGQKSIYKSYDKGLTWIDMHFDFPQTAFHIKDIECLNTSPTTLFIVTYLAGLYKTYVEDKPLEENKFLAIPWQYANENELIDKITSVFDHQYPLLGYAYHHEPAETAKTTVNYLGEEKNIPDLYYSGHDGYDFALPLETNVIAPYSGYASYYYCGDCGNTIKIDHQNGYQSVYMHLHADGLITKNTPVWVEKGDIIGKIGMTGNTSGPHLHFAIIKDTDNDGSFEDEFPWGKTDPFSWQNTQRFDPWEMYTWTDIFGTHTGTKSKYLWNSTIGYNEHYFLESQTAILEHENKKITVTKTDQDAPFNLAVQNSIQPILFGVQNTLKYVANTSLLINITNNIKEKAAQLTTPSKIEIDFSNSDLSNIVLESIKIYVLNDLTGIWEPLPTQLLDLVDKRIIATTTHFSTFAVFGNKIEANPAETTINIQGNLLNGWYKSYPTITFTATKDNANIYYLIGNEIDWLTYTEPFVLEKNGIFGIQYKSIDQNGNIENTKDMLVKIDTQNRFKYTNKILNMNFYLVNNSTPE